MVLYTQSGQLFIILSKMEKWKTLAGSKNSDLSYFLVFNAVVKHPEYVLSPPV